MNKILKQIIVFLILIQSIYANSQYQAILNNVRVNGVAIPNGSPINLGTNTQVNVVFRYTFVKPINATVGTIKNSYGTNGIGTRFLGAFDDPVPTSGDGTFGDIGVTLYDTDTDVNGNGYVQLIAACNSCTPTFTLYSNKLYNRT